MSDEKKSANDKPRIVLPNEKPAVRNRDPDGGGPRVTPGGRPPRPVSDTVPPPKPPPPRPG
jgi:hypothetical protein